MCETMALALLLVAVVTSILFIASTRMICLRWVILVSTLLSGTAILIVAIHVANTYTRKINHVSCKGLQVTLIIIIAVIIIYFVVKIVMCQ